MFRLIVAVLAGLSFIAPPAARAQAPPARRADILLVLAADVSRSIDDRKFELERRGYAAALSEPGVLQAIAAGPNGGIAVAFVEWSGVDSQRLVIDWTLIRNAADAKSFTGRLLEAPRSFSDRTAIGAGIEFARAQFAHSPYTSDRRVIDVSGDGTNNSGQAVSAARDAALAAGVTAINGLVILTEQPTAYMPEHTNPPGGLDSYYRENVVGGANAFVMVAKDFESFGNSLVAKLIREISAAPSPTAVRPG